jgi:hypothetical protein
MSPLFRTNNSDDLPLVYDIDHDAFLQYRKSWLLWRALGHYDSNGSWVRPLSFVEADELPNEKIRLFLDMDDIFEKKRRQLAKNK